MALISDYYKQRFTSISYENILKYFDQLKGLDVIIFFEKKSYEKSIAFLPLELLNILEQIDINSSDFTTIRIDSSVKVLVLVENYFDYSEFLYFLNQNYENNYYDLFNDLLMDIGILNQDESSKLFFNIEKLEKHLNTIDTNKLIKKEFNCYQELLKNLLLQTKEFKYESIIAFYYSHIYYDTFGSIIAKISDCIVFCDDDYTKDNFLYGLNYLILFDFIDIFLGTYIKELPKNSIYINFNHGIIDDPSIALYNKEFTTYRSGKTKKPNINIVGSHFLDSNNSICLGYPKLDKFIAYYNEFREDTQNISIVTSHIIWNFEKLSPVVIDSDFIPLLLKEFSNNKVSFRPHPGCMNHPFIKKYVTQLEEFSNFIFDTEKSYLANLSKTKVFIADGLSSSVYTYAFSTLKPVIFYIPNYEEYMKDYNDLAYVKYMKVIGEIATSHDELLKLVHEHLSNSNFYRNSSKRIGELRNSVIKNIGCSENKIIDFIDHTRKVRNSNQLKTFYKEKLSKLAHKNISDYFDRFRNLKVAIYGAGSHFEKVLKQHYDFNNLNILFFTDKNKSLIGQTIDNIPIVEIEKLKIADVIIISSRAFEIEIKSELEQKFKNIYTIYDRLLYDFLILSDLEKDKELLENLWLNIQEVESNMNDKMIMKLIKNDYSSYRDLEKACLVYKENLKNGDSK